MHLVFAAHRFGRKIRRAPRSLPDRMWAELFAAMTHDRDRALLSFAVSSGARANELLGVTGDRVDWGSQRIWVVSKGTRELSAVPGSPAAFDYLARYFDRCGTPGPAEPIWRTLRGGTRPLTIRRRRHDSTLHSAARQSWDSFRCAVEHRYSRICFIREPLTAVSAYCGVGARTNQRLHMATHRPETGHALSRIIQLF